MFADMPVQFWVRYEPNGHGVHSEQSPARADTHAVGMNNIPVEFLEELLQTKQPAEDD